MYVNIINIIYTLRHLLVFLKDTKSCIKIENEKKANKSASINRPSYQFFLDVF